MADVATAFNQAISEYSATASDEFDRAQQDIQNNTPPGNDAQQKALKTAQGQMAAAFSQLGQAAKMASEQKGREGYAALVDLMTTTATTADAVCTQIRTIAAGTTPNTQLLTALAAVLASLAQLSPAAVWQKPPGGQD